MGITTMKTSSWQHYCVLLLPFQRTFPCIFNPSQRILHRYPFLTSPTPALEQAAPVPFPTALTEPIATAPAPKEKHCKSHAQGSQENPIPALTLLLTGWDLRGNPTSELRTLPGQVSAAGCSSAASRAQGRLFQAQVFPGPGDLPHLLPQQRRGTCEHASPTAAVTLTLHQAQGQGRPEPSCCPEPSDHPRPQQRRV